MEEAVAGLPPISRCVSVAYAARGATMPPDAFFARNAQLVPACLDERTLEQATRRRRSLVGMSRTGLW